MEGIDRRGFLIGVAVVLILGLVTIAFLYSSEEISVGEKENALVKFSSRAEFDNFINESLKSGNNYYGYGGGRGVFSSDEAVKNAPTAELDSSAGPSSSDYSTTNIQVEGVDEADIIKNDDKFIYVSSGDRVVIFEAYPANNLRILSEINFSGGYVQELYINDDKLVIFGNGIFGNASLVEEDSEVESKLLSTESYMPYYNYKPAVLVYDVSDRTKPVLENSVLLDGNYVNSRMVGDYVYIISSKYLDLGRPELPVFYVDGLTKAVSFSDVYYPPYHDYGYQFTTVSALNLENGDFDGQTYLLGNSYSMYVSEKNIYLTQQKYWEYKDYLDSLVADVYLPLFPEKYDDAVLEVMKSDKEDYEKMVEIDGLVSDYFESVPGKDMDGVSVEFEKLLGNFSVKMSKKEKTEIYRIEFDGMNVDYVADGEVPGRVLNQFSMDEYDGNFRIATTTGDSWQGNSLNHLYVLNSDMEVVGAVEDLASGEQIYSARFMGDKAYMVTFKQTDPLFVIDLKNPESPTVLGYLKITGFSNYLHPYDENHLIGIGQEASSDGRVSGMKVSLFDVSDFENPKEISKVEIGDRGTSSSAFYDHKAVLFDKDKNLLVLPVSLYESKGGKFYGDYIWEGVYIFNVSATEINVRGKISHSDVNPKEDYYFYGDQILRSIFMDDVLYTVSNYKIKASWLDSLDEIKSAKIKEKEDYLFGRGMMI